MRGEQHDLSSLRQACTHRPLVWSAFVLSVLPFWCPTLAVGHQSCVAGDTVLSVLPFWCPALAVGHQSCVAGDAVSHRVIYRPHYWRAHLLACEVAYGPTQSAFVTAFLPALAGSANVRACQIRMDHFARFITQMPHSCVEYSARACKTYIASTCKECSAFTCEICSACSKGSYHIGASFLDPQGVNRLGRLLRIHVQPATAATVQDVQPTGVAGRQEERRSAAQRGTSQAHYAANA